MRNLSSALPFMLPSRNQKQNPPLENREQYLRAIYNAYPRHVGKRDALKAFDKALYRLEFEEKEDIPKEFWQVGNVTVGDWLLDRVIIYASSPAGQKGNFTPHPATWANQSRYLDDVQDWFIPDGGNGRGQLPETFAERDSRSTIEAARRIAARLASAGQNGNQDRQTLFGSEDATTARRPRFLPSGSD